MAYIDIDDLLNKQNNEDAAQEIADNEVPDEEVLDADEWNLLVGAVKELQEKSAEHDEAAARVHYYRFSTQPINSYYHLWGFEKQADYTTYISDPETYANLLLVDEVLNISTAQTDSYAAVLATDTSATPSYVIKNGDTFDVNLRYQAIKNVVATSSTENANADGTITVERSTNNGGTWTQVAKISGAQSVDPTATSYPISLPIGDYLVSGSSNRIRIRVSFTYIDDSNVSQTRTSSYIVYNISCVNLALEMATSWETPISVVSGQNALGMSFTLYGAVSKTLHVSVVGAAGTATYENTYDSSYNGTDATVSITNTSATKILDHGVREVTAYLTCSDGHGGTLTSDVMTYHLMVVNSGTDGADLTKPYFLLQEAASVVSNFVQSKICSYAVYLPSGMDSLDIALLLTNSSESILSVSQNEYYRLEQTVEANTKYDLNATVEIEDDSSSTLYAYIHVTRENGTVDFLLGVAGSQSSGYKAIPVDNTSGYAPTSGATFYLNPKTRNNAEANPARILNEKANNAVITSTWTGFKFGEEDGWITDEDGNKVLRIPAGCTLNFQLNPLAQFLTTPASSLTFDIDARMWNVTNEVDPIIQLCELVASNWLGLRMKPMTGTFATATMPSEEETTFSWQEDVRTHFSFNIRYDVAPNVILDNVGDGLTAEGSTTTGTIALVRVLINGRINKEVVFSPSNSNEFCTGAMSNGGFTIGQSGAGIDIYGIKVWANQGLTAQQCMQNRISTIPSSDVKKRMKEENDIMTSNRIDVEKVKRVGKNYLIWHGSEVWHGASSGTNGWWEFGQFDANGNELPDLSGTICRATGSLPSKGQGTTAKTYYYWNIQTKLSDVSATINVPFADLHSSISYTLLTSEELASYKGEDEAAANWSAAAYVTGGNLGKNFPLSTESSKVYEVTTVDGTQCLVVPDGWVDGNGKYRGVGYSIARDLPLAQKLVLKINYASSMQSHIIGVNKLYNDLHRLYVGENALQSAVSSALVAKHLEPFLFFTQASDSVAPIYRGPGAWGPGKMDKPTWGYVKSAYPNFTMIEGADNSKELTDMRVPFDDEVHTGDTYPKVFYNPNEEAFYYRVSSSINGAQKSINFDAGTTYKIASGDVDATHLYAGDYPSTVIVDYIRNAWNFLYLHNPRIKYYNGTFQSFTTDSSVNTDYNYKYWCNDYKLYRYDFADGTWVNAGLWNGTSYDEVLLTDSTASDTNSLAYRTYQAWNALTTDQKADYANTVTKTFIAAIVQHAKENIGTYFVTESVKFHYAFENHFIAGTDNNSKNTYYVLVPVVVSGNTVWKFEMHQDDVDTVLPTDNSGLQTKPYYIDRMHPYKEVDGVPTGQSLYEGQNNVLFNLCEEMWEESGEIADALRSIFGYMATLTGGTGSEESDSMSGVWKTLNRYIFDIQRYIPAMAYNEAARIRYEFPEMRGYVSDQRQVRPITQSMGDQLECELQWMKRRLVYMASYAAFGEFRPQASGSTGISDLSESFAMVMNALPNGAVPSFTFNLTPHQYLYPTAAIAQTSINPHVRVAPGHTYTINISPTQSSDDGITIYGIHYYSSIGNIGDNSFKPSSTFNLTGKRLTSFVAEPQYYYPTSGGSRITLAEYTELSDADKADYLPAFRCSGVNIRATRLQTISLNGCASIGASTVDLSDLTLLSSIDLRNTDATGVQIPETATLSSVQLPSGLSSLSVANCIALETLTLQGAGSISSLSVTNCPLAPTKNLVASVKSDHSDPLTSVTIDNISWTYVPADTLVWLINATSCSLKGVITLIEATSDRYLSFYETIQLIQLFGDIRNNDGDGNLRVNFSSSSIASIAISGDKYIKQTGLFDGWSITCYPSYGNNVAVVNDANGVHEDVTWSFTGDNASDVQEYATWSDAVKGIINVTTLSSPTSEIYFTLQVRVGLITGSYVTATYRVGFFNRIPHVGDFAYYNGTFDSELDTTKSVIGVVFRKEAITNGSTTTGYKIDVMAKDNIAATSYPWGIFLASNGTNGYTQTEIDEIKSDVLTRMGVSITIPDTPLTNYTASGIYNSSSGSYNNSSANSTYRAKDYSGVSADDDGYVNVTNGAAEFDPTSNNETLLNIAKNISQGYWQDGNLPTTESELGSLISTHTGGDGDAAQTYYPAAYACHLYEPSVETGENLHEAYERNQWMLPTLGQLLRIYNFYHNSRNRTNSSSPNVQYANETPDTEAELPLFSNILARVAAKTGAVNPITFPSNSGHWSCTEYNSNGAWYVYFYNGNVTSNNKYYSCTVRPVAAFTFNLDT